MENKHWGYNTIRLLFGLLVLGGGVLGMCGAPKALALQNYLDYQGRLSDSSGNLLTGNYYITFCVYSVSSPVTACSPVASPSVGGVASLGSAMWGETEYFSATNSPANGVMNGVFNAKLGSASAFPSTLFSSNDLWVGVNVYSGTSWDGQMSPLEELLSAGYANNAGSVGGFSASQTPAASQIPVLDSSGNLTLPGSVTIGSGGSLVSGGALGIVSGGAAALTLTSGSGTLSLGAGTNTIRNTDAATALTLNPTGNIRFFSASNFITSAGALTLASNATIGGTLSVTGALTTNATTTINYANLILSGISAPAAVPTLGSSTAGALAATTYYVKYTWTNSSGETTVSPEASLGVLINKVLTVTIPAFPTGVTGANVYVATTTNTETKQGSIAVSAGTWTEPTTGLVGGAAMPTVNSIGGGISASSTQNIFSGAALATANYGVVNIGGGGFGGAGGNFSGSTNGTLLALNAVSGYTGNLVDVQVNGVSKFSIDNTGNIVHAGGHIIGNSLTVFDGYAASGDLFYWRNDSVSGNIGTYTDLMRLDTSGSLFLNGNIKSLGGNATTGLGVPIIVQQGVAQIPNTTAAQTELNWTPPAGSGLYALFLTLECNNSNGNCLFTSQISINGYTNNRHTYTLTSATGAAMSGFSLGYGSEVAIVPYVFGSGNSSVTLTVQDTQAAAIISDYITYVVEKLI